MKNQDKKTASFSFEGHKIHAVLLTESRLVEKEVKQSTGKANGQHGRQRQKQKIR